MNKARNEAHSDLNRFQNRLNDLRIKKNMGILIYICVHNFCFMHVMTNFIKLKKRGESC